MRITGRAAKVAGLVSPANPHTIPERNHCHFLLFAERPNAKSIPKHTSMAETVLSTRRNSGSAAFGVSPQINAPIKPAVGLHSLAPIFMISTAVAIAHRICTPQTAIADAKVCIPNMRNRPLRITGYTGANQVVGPEKS